MADRSAGAPEARRRPFEKVADDPEANQRAREERMLVLVLECSLESGYAPPARSLAGTLVIRSQLLRRFEGNALGPFQCLLVADGELVQEVVRLPPLGEQPPDEGVAGRRGKVRVVFGPFAQIKAQV